jgi:hypothetical protein
VQVTCERALGLLEQALVLMDSKNIDLPAVRLSLAIEDLKDHMSSCAGAGTSVYTGLFLDDSDDPTRIWYAS